MKVVNGSSLATFAALPPVVAPAVAAAGLDRTAAAYALCLGAFVAILPSDSFFWLTQPGGADGGTGHADFTLALVSAVQGLVGLACLYGFLWAAGGIW